MDCFEYSSRFGFAYSICISLIEPYYYGLKSFYSWFESISPILSLSILFPSPLQSMNRTAYTRVSCIVVSVWNIILFVYGASVCFYVHCRIPFITTTMCTWYDKWWGYASSISPSLQCEFSFSFLPNIYIVFFGCLSTIQACCSGQLHLGHSTDVLLSKASTYCI